MPSSNASQTAAASSTPELTVLSATTAAQADEQIHRVFNEILASLDVKSQQTQQSAAVVAVPEGSSVGQCSKAGTVHHAVTSLLMNTAEPWTVPDVGPRARTLLEQRGWTFSAWESKSKRDTKRSMGRQAGYTVIVLYIPGTGGVQLIGTSPCLPGRPVTAPSAFPDSPAQ
ncbi:hypothetical protein [Streptomyces sp. NPDC001070]